MTDKPVKPLSERIRERAGISRAEFVRFQDSDASGKAGLMLAAAYHAETLDFLAELAEMMEKK